MRFLAYCVLVLAGAGGGGEIDFPRVLQSFEEPPRQYTQVPFWFWSGGLEGDEFRTQLREMASKGVYAAMPHPRFGMDRREYLTEKFWQAVAATIDEAKKLDMKIWLYDEYNWPSGGAGGRVTDGRPEFYPRGLDYYMQDVSDGPKTISIADIKPTEPRMERFEKIVRAFIKKDGEPTEAYRLWGTISADAASISGPVGEGKWNVLVFFQCLGRNPSPLDHGSNSMTDYLSERSAERFLELTYDEYFKRFKQEFGGTIPAIFTDESSTTSPSPFPWTGELARRFEADHGFDILDKLPLLLDADSDAGFKIRLAYWQTVTDLFAGGFIGRTTSWCREHGIASTGHVYEENIKSYAHSTQLMTILRRMDIPGFDALGPRCPPHAAKVAISAAHLDDKTEALCECLGLAGGWNCTLDMLRTGYNILGGLGVSRFVPHAFYQTLENPRIECPPSFFYPNPYWKYYKKIADLSSRLTYFNHIGTHVAPCAVYYPIESLWADSVGGKGQGVLPWQHKTEGNAEASRTIKVFNDLIDGLYSRRWDMDIVDDELLSRSTVSNEGNATKLRIGSEDFRVLIVPPVTAIGSRALKAIDTFLRQGGRVVWLERLPRFTWPLDEDEPDATLKKWRPASEPEIGSEIAVGQGRLALLKGDSETVCTWLDAELGPEVPISGNLDALRVTHRKAGTAHFYLLFNDSDAFIQGRMDVRRNHCPLLVDMDTGKSYLGGGCDLGLDVHLRPHQSMCVIYVFDSVYVPGWVCERPGGEKVDISEGWAIQLAGSALDEEWKSSLDATKIRLPVFKVKKREFSDVGDWVAPGYYDADWDEIYVLRGSGLFTDHSSILFRANLPPGAKAIQAPLPVTGEYALWVNGKLIEKNIGPQSPEPRQIDLNGKLEAGKNILALETYSHHTAAGLAEPIKLTCGPAEIERLQSWRELGFGFYSGRVLYRKKISTGGKFKRAWLDLGKVEHYVEVFVNGRLVDTLLWPPYEIEITAGLKEGENDIVLVVANSLANRFAWDVWGTRGKGKAEPSGILGPACLWLER